MKKKTKKFKVFVTLGAAFAVIAVYIILSLYLSANYLVKTTYKYEADKITAPVRVLVLTDEHDHSFGEENQDLIDYVKKQSPDLIAIVGDCISYYAENDQFLLDVIEKLDQISPVYFSPGNHEAAYLTKHKMMAADFKQRIEGAGGVYLDQSYADVTVNGQQIRIGGLNDFVFNHKNVPEEQYHKKDSYIFLQHFTDTEAFKILLNHQPESFITQEDDAKWDIDLGLCGHEHGGQIRIPLIGGFYSSHLGWFPEYVDGYHIMNGIPVVISRGLGTYRTSHTPPRFNNLPEIVQISLT